MPSLKENLVHLMNHIGQLNEEAIRDLMSKILSGRPGIGWELGPDPSHQDRMTLALTGLGRWEHLKEFSQELSLPIETQSWAIVAGIPPRGWERYFEIQMDNGESVGIECGSWMWSLVACRAFAEIVLLLPESMHRLGELENEAVSIFLSGELGEQNYCERIKVVGIEHLTESMVARELLPVTKLRCSFATWFPDAPYADFLSTCENE
jgi:hypothetical protein